ncbi:hypothetical protein Daus18300_002980 [Diaporthe australafricana]|uniref:RNase H type-1 domain-containing protein n=1 Tax=Diaporthe australafricana TaxID=127596 RepID=A0ABR3XJC5_9PEZI
MPTMPRYRVTKSRNPAALEQAIQYDSSDSEADERITARRQLAQSDRGVRLLPRTSADQAPRRLTRSSSLQIQPAGVFRPQDHFLAPEQHFPLQTIHTRTQYPRYVNRFNSKEIMLVVDGSCVNNGAGVGHNPPVGEENAPKGGLSFIYNYNAGKIAMPLEQKGPRGDTHRHTSNRAKLRAVIAALDFRPWHGEGWQTVVVVTDLEYVVHGATRWLPAWVARRWRLAPRRDARGRLRLGRKLANRDLWEELQSRIESLRVNGTEVAFWLVPPRSLVRQDSELLREAKSAAREAARGSGAAVGDYTRLCGLFV